MANHERTSGSGNIKVVECLSPRPYVGTEVIIRQSEHNGKLPRAKRTLTHLARYQMKEAGRERVDVSGITGRAKIGKIR